MNQFPRPKPAGPTYFFTVSLAQSGSTLMDHFQELSDAIEHTQAAMPFFMDAWVVMPDHLHAVWTLPAGDAGYAMRWGQIKRRFTMALPSGLRGSRSLWQRGVAVREITGLQDYSDAVRRCWFDPVRHEMATIPEDWTLSSAHLEPEKNRMVA